MKTFLNVGCGPKSESKIRGFDNDDWKEIRLDIDEGVNPDIVGTLTDMKLVETASVDAVHSAYNIDHIYPHEVPIALAEFYRVLKEDGIVYIRCPDIQLISEAVINDQLLEALYESPAGPISPIDIIYGNRQEIVEGNEYMAKKCGFTYSVLNMAFWEAGFKTRYGGRNQDTYELSLIAFKQEKSEEEIKKIANPFFQSE
ncbi:MAG: class I SAM-dependent methyltransferase [Alphaproteobacteria bacterium]|nr:class I SAM-dependent methyltransferase [Alphaproteobacteria bacterium]